MIGFLVGYFVLGSNEIEKNINQLRFLSKGINEE